MKNFFNKLKSLLPSKRRLIQLYTALLFNANIKGFISGQIYQGPVKNLCAPGINCYACPGASAACPLGALQNAFTESNKRTPYYILGIILLYSIMFGRMICGFFCPFGMIQELLYKIKTPKLKKTKATRVFSYLKYVILVFFVILLPIAYATGAPIPAFCKYICPVGTLEGAGGLLPNHANNELLASLGGLFTWKFAVLMLILVASIFIFRFFCRFLCPLGALYGLFNKISIFGIKLNKDKCIDCGKCKNVCKVDIKCVGDHECVNCGECIGVCPTKAITWRGSQFFLAPNEIDVENEKGAPLTEAEKETIQATKKKIEKRRLVTKIVSLTLAGALLIGALVYYNFIYEAQHTHADNDDDGYCDDCGQLLRGEDGKIYGNALGDYAYGYELNITDENGLTGEKFNPAKNSGRITIINFWGTWCPGCVAELPHFDDIATEYKDLLDVVAIHSDYDRDTAADWIKNNMPNSDIIFAIDDKDASNPSISAYFKLLDGGSTYPMTVILNPDGTIAFKTVAELNYDELKTQIDNILLDYPELLG